ncbi:MAG: hypothetical protein E7107_10050 [Prevotella sp.]|nr:hypothetical protein [Prevotella sp.]
MVELLMEFLSKPFTEAYMIHNAGNENENPRSQTVIAEFEEGVRKLCLKQVRKTVGEDVDEENIKDTVNFLKLMLMKYIQPTLTSMLTDTNQASDATLTSRTNDLQVVLTIPKPTQ